MSVWLEDADIIKLGDKALEIVHHNNLTLEYINGNKLGISGTRGQGKTFLIKYKRYILSKSPNVTMFPKDFMVDTIDSSIVDIINFSLKKILDIYKNWVSIWKFAISATIINSNEYQNYFDNSDFLGFSPDALFLLNKELDGNNRITYCKHVNNDHNKPSHIFGLLIQKEHDTLMNILFDVNKAISLLTRINNGIYIFIDKVDQAFVYNIMRINGKSSKNASYWQYSQYALAHAAYDILTTNNHIKVFYTIQKEALHGGHQLSGYPGRNAETYCVNLFYSKEDIFRMFQLYVMHEDDYDLNNAKYKHSNAELAFFGFNEIKHPYVPNVVETPFNYLYRHSLRRPCDLMSLCRSIYEKGPKELTGRMFRRTINEVADDMLNKYLVDIEPFITLSRDNILSLLSRINTNIFDLEYMQAVCEIFNTEHENIIGCNKNCDKCITACHPFSSLQNVGLLGYLRSSEANPIPQQEFLPIGDSRLKPEEHSLKPSQLYFLHSCLSDITRVQRNQRHQLFQPSNATIVGEGVLIEQANINEIKSNLTDLKKQIRDDRVFISSTVRDLSSERNTVKRVLFEKRLFPVLSESITFKYGADYVDSHDHCIDEALKCKFLVLIIGNQYGGEYQGTHYKKYYDEIVELSNGQIESPSITIMEFFVARKNGVKCKVFISKNTIDEKYAAKEGRYLYETKSDKRVFKLINFINHISENGERKGNWYITYNSSSDLAQKLHNLAFD